MSTWGLFPRPSNISSAYGGGRTIKPGEPLESPEQAAKRIRESNEALARYKKKASRRLWAPKSKALARCMPMSLSAVRHKRCMCTFPVSVRTQASPGARILRAPFVLTRCPTWACAHARHLCMAPCLGERVRGARRVLQPEAQKPAHLLLPHISHGWMP